MKKFLIFLIILIFVAGGIGYYSQQQKIKSISSFEECAAAGYPIMESYPPRCTVPGGRSFTQEIGKDLNLPDSITFDNLNPNQKVKSPLKITGKAYGEWYFEGSFPVRIVDNVGNKLSAGAATAKGDWMTTNPVPFEVNLEFETNAKEGRVIFEKDNPSGDPKNSLTVEIPVKF